MQVAQRRLLSLSFFLSFSQLTLYLFTTFSLFKVIVVNVSHLTCVNHRPHAPACVVNCVPADHLCAFATFNRRECVPRVCVSKHFARTGRSIKSLERAYVSTQPQTLSCQFRYTCCQNNNNDRHLWRQIVQKCFFLCQISTKPVNSSSSKPVSDCKLIE